MGASEFTKRAKGATAKEAFSLAVDEARYEYGHGGYTGTIAEKHEFKMVYPKDGESPEDCINRLMDDEDHFCNDKWGPAAAIKIKDGLWCFFGYASS